MKEFLKRHRGVHIWLLGVLTLFGVYWYGTGSPQAANAISAFTQRMKDGYARLWYLFPFSVVEWFYAAFILGVMAWLAVLFYRLRTRKGRRWDTAYGGVLGLACLFLTTYGFYCVTWGVNYYADGFQEKSGIYAQPVSVEELYRVTALMAEGIDRTAPLVERDEREQGERKLLNLGHTVGHAIEKCSGYTVPHGHAVAAGLAVMARAAERLNWTTGPIAQRIGNCLEKLGLPVSTEFPPEALAEAALADKKRAGDSITIVVPKEIGTCELLKIPVSELLFVIGTGWEA